MVYEKKLIILFNHSFRFFGSLFFILFFTKSALKFYFEC